MLDVLNLALPYFSLIFIGFACGKATGLPEAGLAWMNFFLPRKSTGARSPRRRKALAHRKAPQRAERADQVQACRAR